MATREEISAEAARKAALIAEHASDGAPPLEGGVYIRTGGALEKVEPAGDDTAAARDEE